MRYLELSVLLIALISQSVFARCPRMARTNPIMAALQNVFQSGNNMPMPSRSRRIPVETGMPVNGLNMPLPYMRNLQEKCSCQIEKPCPRMLPEMRVPDILNVQEIRRPEIRVPDILNVQEIRRPEMRVPTPIITEMPKQYFSNMPVNTMPARLIPEVIDMPKRPVAEVVSIPRVPERFDCVCASPRALVNPFLPAASPISAYAPPTPNLLPPTMPKVSRSQFLRKIPIPPPTL